MKHDLLTRIKKTVLHSRGEHKLIYKKRPLIRLDKALMGNYPRKSFFFNKGNLIKIEEGNPKKGKVEFWHMKLIHELFPKNVPKVRAVEPLKENSTPIGYILHLEEVELNQELRNYMNTMIQTGKQNIRDIDFQNHLKQVNANINVDKTTEQMGNWGIITKYKTDKAGIGQNGNASNVSIANPNTPLFFEPKIYSKERFEKKLEQSKLSKRKKGKIRRYYERLKKAEAELKKSK